MSMRLSLCGSLSLGSLFLFSFSWDARQEAAPIGLSSPIVSEPTHEITIELGGKVAEEHTYTKIEVSESQV